MKVVALLGATLLATPALAQDETVEVEIEELADGDTPDVRFFGFGDMATTRDEAAARAAERFAERDKDGNGVLEGEEMARFEFRRPMGAMMLGDGKAMPRLRTMMHREKMDPAEMFDKIDTDENGSISREEFEAHHKDHSMHGDMPRMTMKRMELPEGGDHVVVNTWSDEKSDGEVKREVIVRRLGEGEKLDLPEVDGDRRVIVRRMGDGGSWTTDGDHKTALARIETMLGGREDADGDGKVTEEEAIAAALARFDALDRNGDGTLSEDERPHIVRRVVEIKD